MFPWLPHFSSPDLSFECQSHISSYCLIFPFGCHTETSNITFPTRTLDFPQASSSPILSISENATIIYPIIQVRFLRILRPSLFLIFRSNPASAFMDFIRKHILTPAFLYCLHFGHSGPLQYSLCFCSWPAPFHSLHLSNHSNFKSDLSPLLKTL